MAFSMTVMSAAFVAGGNFGQGLGGFKKEILGESGFHAGSLPHWKRQSSER